MKFYDPKPLSDSARELLSKVAVATLTSQLAKRGLQSTHMPSPRPLNPKTRLVGPAYTVRMIPAREDITGPHLQADPEYPQRKAIEATPPGHVLIYDCRGDTSAAVAGDILVERLRVRGVAGICTDGGIRDTAAMDDLDFPIFCAARSAPASTLRLHGLDAMQPIGCGGVTVLPGDILVGDIEGVVVIPSPLADVVAEDAAEQELMESYIYDRIKSGESIVGRYPPNDQTMADYETWKASR